MARLGDVSKVFRSIGPLELGRRVVRQVNDDRLFTWAAALAYSWLFAIFPFVLFLLTLIPYLPGKLRHDAERNLPNFVTSWLPTDAARILNQNIDVKGHITSFLNQEPRRLLLYTGLLVALWAASSGMAATMSALDKCYELDRGRPFIRQRLLAIVMTIAVMVFLLLVACMLPIGGLVRDWIISRGMFKPWGPILILFNVVRWLLALLFMLGVVTLVYYKGPGIKHRFHWITPGATFCVTVWVLLGIGFRLYMDRIGGKGYDRMYGTLGGAAILLLLFYLDALVLLIGAEINSEIDFEVLKVRRGTHDLRRAEDLDAVPTGI